MNKERKLWDMFFSSVLINAGYGQLEDGNWLCPDDQVVNTAAAILKLKLSKVQRRAKKIIGLMGVLVVTTLLIPTSADSLGLAPELSKSLIVFSVIPLALAFCLLAWHCQTILTINKKIKAQLINLDESPSIPNRELQDVELINITKKQK